MTKAKSPSKAVTYCRVSSTRQVREGHGIHSQDTRCREFAKHKGYEVIRSFHDEGVSGSLIDRPKMQEMLNFLSEQDETVFVLIDDISRLARGLEAHLQLRTAIGDVGAKLESPSIEFGEDSDSILVENLLASVSQHQRQKNAEQVKNRMRARVLNGYWISNPPIGYKYKAINGHGKMLVRNEPIASILQTALELFACGRLETQSEFRDYLLAQDAFPRKKDGTIHLQQVKEMLNRVLYAGYISMPKWDIYMQSGKHEPLISLDTYEKIQKRLNSTAKAPQRKDLDQNFPLRGFVCCNSCGHPMTSCWSRSANKNRYAYYLCQRPGCDMKGKSVRREKLESEFEELLLDLVPSFELTYIATDMMRDIWDAKTQQGSTNGDALKAEYRILEQKITKLVDRVLETESVTLIERYENALKDLERKKALIQEKLLGCSKEAPSFDRTFQASIEFLRKPYKMWASGDIDQQRTMLKLAFDDKITYELKKGFRTPSISSPLRLCKHLQEGEYEMVRLP